MSQTGEERVQAFRDAVNASPELQAKVTAEDADWVEIAQAAGHEITAEEVQAYMTAHENDELSEFELEAVAGGYGRGNDQCHGKRKELSLIHI